MQSAPSGVVESRKVSTAMTMEGFFTEQQLASSPILERSPLMFTSRIASLVSLARSRGRCSGQHWVI